MLMWTAATSSRTEAEESRHLRHAARALPGDAPAAVAAKEAHEGFSVWHEVRHPGAARCHRTGVVKEIFPRGKESVFLLSYLISS
jgi:hypothetical protein